jgi:NADH-quinone oxidoreductase subunit C
MTTFSVSPEVTLNAVQAALGKKIKSISVALNEVTVLVSAEDYVASSVILKDDSACGFEQLIDLCGVDYSEYLDGSPDGLRFCVVCHLLSVSLNQRVRLKVFAADDLAPTLPSLIEVWSAANWFEREAFDLFGIVFDGHTDLRRILTDYGFVGHPFRKDFPRTGHVEMRFDAELGRIVYQPITIEDREITPRVIRESNYGGLQ